MDTMKWYGLYADGHLIAVKKWFGVPGVRDFGVGETPSMSYEIREAKTETRTYSPNSMKNRFTCYAMEFDLEIPFTPSALMS